MAGRLAERLVCLQLDPAGLGRAVLAELGRNGQGRPALLLLPHAEGVSLEEEGAGTVEQARGLAVA